MRSFNRLIVVMTGLLAAVAFADGQETPVQLSPQLIEHFLSSEKCLSNAQHLHSCIEAFNAGAEMLETPAVVVPTSLRPYWRAEGEEVVGGFTVLFNPKAQTFTSLKARDQFNFKRFKHMQKAAESYLEAGADTLKISERMMAAASTFTAEQQLQFWLAALNAQLGHFDPHAYLRLETKGRRLASNNSNDVPVNAVSARMLSDDVGYVHLNDFDHRNTCQWVKSAVEGLQEKGMQKLILDLRGNGGGQRMAGVCVAGLFVGTQPIMGLKNLPSTIPGLTELVEFEMEPQAEQEIFWLNSYQPKPFEMPMVVLIDADSASAAEVVAGALQNYERAWLVGDRSFGKGVSQTAENLKSELAPRVQIVYTTEVFFQPTTAQHSLRSNQLLGIVPNFFVGAKDYASREGTLFPNALRGFESEYTDTRTAQAEAVRQCVDQESRHNSDDQQLAYAIGVLSCDQTR